MMVAQRPADRDTSPGAPTRVAVQITVWGDNNEVHVDSAAIARALSRSDRSRFGEFLTWLLERCRQLVQAAWRFAVLFGNQGAAVLVMLGLLGSC